MVIVKDKVPNAAVQIPSIPGPAEETAAAEFQKYIYKISGAKLPIIPQLRDTFLNRLIIADLSRHPGIEREYSIKVEGEFSVVKDRNTIWLVGATGASLLSGIYTVLRQPPMDLRICMPGEGGESFNCIGTIDFRPPEKAAIFQRRDVLGLLFPETPFEAKGEVPSPLRPALIDWASKGGLAGVSFINPTVAPQMLRGAGLLDAARRMMQIEFAADLSRWLDRADGRLLAKGFESAAEGQEETPPERRFLIPFCTADDAAAAQLAQRIARALRGVEPVATVRLEPGPGKEVCRCGRCAEMDIFPPAEATDPPGRGGLPFGGNPRDHNRARRWTLFVNQVAERLPSRGNAPRLRAVFGGPVLGPPRQCALHPSVEPVIDLSGRCYSHGISESGRCRINKDYWSALNEWKAFLGGRGFMVREPLAGSAEMLDLPAPLCERIVSDWAAFEAAGATCRVVEACTGRFVPYGANLFAMTRLASAPQAAVAEYADIMYGNAGPAYLEIYRMFADGLNRIREGKGADPDRFGEDACCFRMRAADFLALMDQAEFAQINELVDKMLSTRVPIRCVENMERLRQHIGYVRLARKALLAIRSISESVLAGNPEQTLKAREEAARLCQEVITYLGAPAAAEATFVAECSARWNEMLARCAGPLQRKQE